MFYYEKFENPFKVCHENVCKENVTNYYFEKGKSYQIYVKLLKVFAEGSSTRYDFVVPPFKFYAEDSVEFRWFVKNIPFGETCTPDSIRYRLDEEDTCIED